MSGGKTGQIQEGQVHEGAEEEVYNAEGEKLLVGPVQAWSVPRPGAQPGWPTR